jgi:hypothetical protein
MLATFGWILQENGGGLIKYHDAAGAVRRRRAPHIRPRAVSSSLFRG